MTGTEEEQEEQRAPHSRLTSPHTFSWPPPFACRSLGGDRPLGAPRHSPPLELVQYLKIPPLLLFFLLLSGEARAGAVAGSPASVSGLSLIHI